MARSSAPAFALQLDGLRNASVFTSLHNHNGLRMGRGMADPHSKAMGLKGSLGILKLNPFSGLQGSSFGAGSGLSITTIAPC